MTDPLAYTFDGPHVHLTCTVPVTRSDRGVYVATGDSGHQGFSPRTPSLAAAVCFRRWLNGVAEEEGDEPLVLERAGTQLTLERGAVGAPDWTVGVRGGAQPHSYMVLTPEMRRQLREYLNEDGGR